MTAISLREAREQIVQHGRSLVADGLTQQTSGNLSVRVGDEIAISPSGIPYDDISADDIVVVDLEGSVVEGTRTPSSETPLHTATYRNREDVGAVVHSHSPYATTFACLGRPIDPVHYLISTAGKGVPVAAYGRNGTEDLGRKAVEAIGPDGAVLLRNHGVMTVGDDLPDAYDVAARVEFSARMHYQAEVIGDPEPINETELDALINYFR